MTRTRKLLLWATAAVAAIAFAAPAAASASTTVQPAGEEIEASASDFSFTFKSGAVTHCPASATVTVPSEPGNFAEEGPVTLSMSPPFFGFCWVTVPGGGSIPASFSPNWGAGPWSLYAESQFDEETEETQTFLDLDAPKDAVTGFASALGCTVVFFDEGDEVQGTFDNATSMAKFSGPVSIDGSKCGGVEGPVEFNVTYKIEGLSITQ